MAKSTKKTTKPAPPKEDIYSTELGASGTVIYYGRITDRDYVAEMVGSAGIETIQRMRRGDATVRAALLAVKLPIMSAHWYLEAGGDEEADKEALAFFEDQIFNNGSRTWQEFIREGLSYLDFGYYVFEQILQTVQWKNKQLIGLRKMAARLPGTIRGWKMSDGEDGVEQWTIDKGNVDIPIWKLLILTNEKEGDNWEGMSLLRPAYKHWYYKENLYKIEAIAHERQGLGIPYVKVPSTAGDKDKQTAEEIVKNLRTHHLAYLKIPQGWEAGFLDAKGSGTKNPENAIKHHDRQIVKSVLAQFIELGATGTGSYALNESQNDLFMLSLQSIASYFRDAYQRYVIDRIHAYNFSTAKPPQLKYERIGNVDVEKLSTAIQRLSQSGAMTINNDEELENYLRTVAGLPQRPERAPVPDDIGDSIMADIDAEMANLEAVIMSGEEEEPDPTEEEVQQAAEQIVGAAPLSDDHKSKISEALKKWWESRKGKKSKSSGKGKKSKNPAVEAKRKEIKSLRDEVAKFRTEMRRQILEKKARGEKITEEESAKMQLELLNKSEKIQERIRTLQNEIEAEKGKQNQASEMPKAFAEFIGYFKEGIGKLFRGY